MSTAETVTPDSAVVLHDIPWATYVALRDMPENRNIRMTYDGGELEITSPSLPHEHIASVLGTLVNVWTVELDIAISSCRMMTIRRAELKRGFEPDNCYYVQNEPRVWDKTESGFHGRSAARPGNRCRDQPQWRAEDGDLRIVRHTGTMAR